MMIFASAIKSNVRRIHHYLQEKEKQGAKKAENLVQNQKNRKRKDNSDNSDFALISLFPVFNPGREPGFAFSVV